MDTESFGIAVRVFGEGFVSPRVNLGAGGFGGVAPAGGLAAPCPFPADLAAASDGFAADLAAAVSCGFAADLAAAASDGFAADLAAASVGRKSFVTRWCFPLPWFSVRSRRLRFLFWSFWS